MKKNDVGIKIDKVVETLKKADIKQSEFVKLMESINDPFLVLICCILSLRTNDRTTYPASLRMLELGRTPFDFLKVKQSDLERAIYPVGFYKNKSTQIIEISRILVEEYEGRVPDSIEELTRLKGVGRKTANLTIAKGFLRPAICVDVHVHRICNRLGYVKTKAPDETEMALREKLPEEFWIDFNTLLVTLGQNICKPQKPNCASCPINVFCKKII